MIPVSNCKLIVALDFDRLAPALRLACKVAPFADMFKVGSQLFTAEGPRAVRALARLGVGIFLDLKFHDIPNSVAGAVQAAATLSGVRLINVHATGGLQMMRAAARALAGRRNHPKLLAVTILTSLDALALRRIGLAGPSGPRVVQLAKLAREAGLDGVVASSREIRAIRRACGQKFLIVVPGIRPRRSGSSRRDDQSRTATPAEAARAGADFIVVGRPITAAPNPAAAARAIAQELALASRN
ncbi:MAG TPA: orotidine-5'-phosphate decarboxylase [Candidatus Acidoferrales bacterium]|nr:orotidine-5'-phosphate decarboxylase [Candidatus Acidoferrales bacterium]